MGNAGLARRQDPRCPCGQPAEGTRGQAPPPLAAALAEATLALSRAALGLCVPSDPTSSGSVRPAAQRGSSRQSAFQTICATITRSAAQLRTRATVPVARRDGSRRACSDSVKASGSPTTIMPEPSRFRTSPQQAPILIATPAMGSSEAAIAMIPFMPTRPKRLS